MFAWAMPRTRRMCAVCPMLAAVLVAGGCGSSSSGAVASSSSGPHTLTVDAAASLTGAFTDLAGIYQQQHPGWRVINNFAGTDQLAAQVEQGQRADVFAGASP